MFSSKVRNPARAGQFYPQSPEALREEVEKYIEEADIESVDGRVLGIIVPHAGYVYSGHVAAHAFKTIENADIEDVLLVGPSHFVPFSGIAACSASAFRTPIGDVPVNEALLEDCMNAYREVISFPDAHVPEHSLEVELPFLQVVQSDFKILPLLVRGDEDRTLTVLSEIMLSFLNRERRLVVVSVDLSHFHPYDVAMAMDQRGLEPVVSLDPELFWKRVSEGETEIDAPGAVYALLKALKERGNVGTRLLKYANSGDVSGDRSSVVGYSALVFYSKSSSSLTD